MNEDDMKKMVEAANKGGPLGAVVRLQHQMGAIINGLNQLDMGVMGIAQEVHALGLVAQMVMTVFIDKGILTKEEAEQYQKKYVAEPLNKAIAEAEQKMKEAGMAVEAAREEAEEKAQQEVIVEEQEEEVEYTGDVVLASEREDNVIRFPNARKDS